MVKMIVCMVINAVSDNEWWEVESNKYACVLICCF